MRRTRAVTATATAASTSPTSARIADRNGNGLADPEDLILDPAYSNGIDDDRNGYVDDISGWDFLYGDNDPLDTVEYGHGTGEAKDSTARRERHRRRRHLPAAAGCCPVRVADSFIADGGRFAAGVLFAVDSGADVVQEALGALDATRRQAQQAIDAAYERRVVVVVASMADEASKHPNLPGVARAHDGGQLGHREGGRRSGRRRTGWLALNGCTNFGGRTFVAVPSGSCSSEATGSVGRHGRAARVAARDAGSNRTATCGATAAPAPTSSARTKPCRSSAAPSTTSTSRRRTRSIPPTTSARPPAASSTPCGTRRRPGWDATFGYGRVNSYEMMKAVQRRAHPARGRHHRRRRGSTCCRPSGELTVDGRVARRPRRVVRLPRRVGGRSPAAGRTRRATRGTSPRERTDAASRRARRRSPASTSPRSRRRCPTAAPAPPSTPRPASRRRGAFQRAPARRRHRARRRRRRPRR